MVMIDNYDSFTYNLVQYLGELGAELVVYRNDAITVDEVVARARRHGDLARAGHAREAGVSLAVIRALRGPSRSSACASATRRWARPSAAGRAGPAPIHGKTS